MKFYQRGTVAFVATGLMFIVSIVALAVYQAGFIKLIPIGILILLVFLCFYKLEVEVTDQAVDVRFGIGLIHKHIAISKISKATPVKNSWWMGWGIRLGLDYTLYNVSGWDAVELRLKGQSRKIRIGTNAPDKLADLINQKISS